MLTNFSWLVPGQIAGSDRPGGAGWEVSDDRSQLEDDLEFLQEMGIRAVVSLTEKPLDKASLQARNFRYLHLPVPDMQPPDIEDIVHFASFVEQAKNEGYPVVVHCKAGMGRTGTMLACYLLHQLNDPQEAIEQIRKLRPGSVETAEQEEVVYQYAHYLDTHQVINT